MQMTRIFVSAAIVYCLSICGVGAQNHQALVVRELGARSSPDQLLPTQDCPTGLQDLASNPIPVDAEYLEKLKSELQDLLLEKEKVKQSQDKDKKKRLATMKDSINKQRRKVQGAEMGLSTIPKRLLYGNRRKVRDHRSITQLQERVEKLKEQRDRAQGTERARLSLRLAMANYSLRQERLMQEIGAGQDPRKAEDLYGSSCSSRQRRTAERRVKKLAELEMKKKEEQDSAQLKKLKENFQTVKRAMNKAEKKGQQSHKPHEANDSEKADESKVGAIPEAAHMPENLNSNGVQLGGGLGEGEDSFDAGCFKEALDHYLWGQQCN